MISSLNFPPKTFSNLADLIAALPKTNGKQISKSKYVSDLINKQHELIKPPHNGNLNGVSEQPKQEEEANENDNAGAGDK